MTIHSVHDAPVWRDKADFILQARLPEDGRAEQIWSRQISEVRFEICCIPFFVYDLSLGDVVETSEDYWVERVVEVSGRYVFRMWFGESTYPPQLVVDELESRGALIEWSSPQLVAVDAANQAHADEIAGFLSAQQQSERLIFETGRT